VLEIFAIYKFCQHFGKKLRAKGRESTGYLLLFIVMWFFFEIVGGIIGMIVTGEGGGAYVMGLMGALCSVALMGYIVSIAPPKNAVPMSYGFPTEPEEGPPPLPADSHEGEQPRV